jgi:hypothetical protein
MMSIITLLRITLLRKDVGGRIYVNLQEPSKVYVTFFFFFGSSVLPVQRFSDGKLLGLRKTCCREKFYYKAPQQRVIYTKRGDIIPVTKTATCRVIGAIRLQLYTSLI